MKRRLQRMLSIGLVAMVVLCLSGCVADSGKRSASTLRSDVDRNAAESADEATTATSGRTESGTKPSDVETGSTATGTATQGNSTAGKVTGNVSPATKATRKPTTATTTKPSGTLTATQAKSIAEDLVYRFQQYDEKEYGIVCDLEKLDKAEWDKIKKFNQNFGSTQTTYRITCCHSVDEVKQHICRCIGDSLTCEVFDEDRFFYDDKNNLYLDTEWGYTVSDRKVEILDYSSDVIRAKSHMGDSGVYDYVTIEKKNGNYVITAWKRKFLPLKCGAYMGKNDIEGSEAIMVLKENGKFTLKSNFDLKSLKSGPVFTLNGTYAVDECGPYGKEISFYYENGEEYWTYWLGYDGTYFHDQCTVFNYVG